MNLLWQGSHAIQQTYGTCHIFLHRFDGLFKGLHAHIVNMRMRPPPPRCPLDLIPLCLQAQWRVLIS